MSVLIRKIPGIGRNMMYAPRGFTCDPHDKETLLEFFKQRGYSVEINKPFAGSIVPLKYYQSDRRVSSVMIELNRRLYIDHDLNKTKGYRQIKKDVAKAIESIVRFL